jgi:hypothetical protein
MEIMRQFEKQKIDENEKIKKEELEKLKKQEMERMRIEKEKERIRLKQEEEERIKAENEKLLIQGDETKNNNDGTNTNNVDNYNLNPVQASKKGMFQSLDYGRSDFSSIKHKIDNTWKNNREIMQQLEKSNSELAKKFDQIQKDKDLKLKDYRDQVLKMKMDKRANDYNQHMKEESLYNANQDSISDEVRTRMEMRKQLAEKLKK